MSITPLRRLLLINGIALTLQGITDVALGPWLQLGSEVSAGADSDARFLGGMLVGVGVLFIAFSRRLHVPLAAVQVLAAGMLLGVAGRVVSLVTAGGSSPLMNVLIVIEAITTGLVLTFSLLATQPTPSATTSSALATV